MSTIIINIPEIVAALAPDELFQRPMLDTIEEMVRWAVINRSMPNAVRALDALRQQFEEASKP